MAIKSVEMDLEYMNAIPNPPRPKEDLYAQACSSDTVTINSWRDIWLRQIKANHEKYGPFNKNHVGELFNKYDKKPVIVAGSGPSLRKNIDQLKDTKGIPIISCLHNFHFMVDHDVPVDYYVTLDAGSVTIEEVHEGSKNPDPEFYWNATKGKTLLAFVGTHPDLLAKWQGEIKFFTCPLPDMGLYQEIQAIEPFTALVSTGGNVLGACSYIAKLMGANPLVFVGADFSFSYTKQFHPWKSKYDGKLGEAMRAVDVYGNKALTWQSYWNFAQWFNWLACAVPGIYINCTEGGILGAYPEGIISQIQTMDLSRLVSMYNINSALKEQCEDPTKLSNIILF